MSASSPVQGPSFDLRPAPGVGSRRLVTGESSLGEGVRLLRAEVSLPEGDLAVEPVASLRGRTLELERFELELDLGERAGESALSVRWEDDRLLVESEDEGSSVLARVEAHSLPGGALRLGFEDALPIGSAQVPMAERFAALGRVLGDEGRALGPRARVVDPLTGWLRAVFPRNGWKVPRVDGCRLRLLPSASAGRVVLEARRGEVDSPPEPLVELRLDGLPLDEQPRTLAVVSELSGGSDPEAIRVVEELARAHPDHLLVRWWQAWTDSRNAEPLEALARKLRTSGERSRPGWLLARAARYAPADRRLRLLEDAVVLRPEDVRLVESLAEALVAAGRSGPAVRALRRLAQLAGSPASRASAHARAGRIQLDAGEVAGALRDLERAVRLDEGSVESWIALAEGKARAGASSQAEADLERLLRSELGTDPRIRISLARLKAADRPAEAIELLEPIGGTSPTGIEVDVLVLEFAERLGEPERAEAALGRARQALERSGALSLEFRPLLLGALKLEVLRGHTDVATQQLAEAWRLGPAKLDELDEMVAVADAGDDERLADRIRRHGARLLLAQREPDRAVELWRELFSQRDPESRSWLDARAELEAAVREHPASIPLLDLAAEVARSAGDFAGQVEHLQARVRAERAPARKLELLSELARGWRSLGRPLLAAKALEEALAIDADQPELLSRLADLHRGRDDRPRLAAALGRLGAVSEGPARIRAFAERARILAALGEDAPAREAVESALEAGDDSAVSWSLATVLALRLGDFEAARARAKTRLARTEGRPAEERLPIWVDLARVSEALGESESLIHALREGLALAPAGSSTAAQLADRLSAALTEAGEEEQLAELEEARGGQASLPVTVRAGLTASAAERWLKLERPERAVRVAERVLELDGSGVVERARGRALDVLEAVARSAGDLGRLARVLGWRAEGMGSVEQGQRLRLEQVDLLERSGASAEALAAGRAAARAFPDSLGLTARLGGLAEAAGEWVEAAEAFERAAGLAARGAGAELALGLATRSARAYAAGGVPERARAMDELVLRRALEQGPAEEGLESLDRLARALSSGDIAGKRRLLEARVQLATGEDRRRASTELAELALSQGRVADAIEHFEAALTDAESADAEVVETLEDRLDDARAAGGRSADRVDAFERRIRGVEGPAAALLWLRAARVLEAEGDLEEALQRVRLALRSDPELAEAREARLRWVRAVGSRDERVSVFEEEGHRQPEAPRAAELWLEAARTLLEDSHSDEGERRQAHALASRAALADPRSSAALRCALEAIASVEGSEEEELKLLGQLAHRAPSPEERLRCKLRRAELLERVFDNPTSALTELSSFLDAPEGLRQSALRSVWGDRSEPERDLYRMGAELAARVRDADTEEVYLFRWQGCCEGDEAVDVCRRRARLLQDELSDEAGAEHVWQEVLRAHPRDEEARERLKDILQRSRRWSEIATRLGPEALERVWIEAEGEEAMSAATALLEHKGGAERAELLLWIDQRDPTLRGLAGLEEAAALGDPAAATVALARIGERAAEAGDLESAAEAWARRAELSPDPETKARSRLELARARMSLGDYASAGAALAAARVEAPGLDGLDEARRAQLVGIEDFDTLAEEFGVPALEDAFTELRGASGREASAISAARALAARVDGAGARWWSLAELFLERGREPEAMRALAAVAESNAPEAPAAWERLAELARVRGDLRAHVDALGQLAESPGSEVDRRARWLRLGAAQAESGASPDVVEASYLRAWELGVDEEVADALSAHWVETRALEKLGRVLGLARLANVGERHPDSEREALTVLVRLAEGPERVEALLRLAELEERADRTDAAIEAWTAAASEGSEPARHRLGARLIELRRFDALAERVSVDALREWVRANEGHEAWKDGALALARALQHEGSVSTELSALWVRVGDAARSEDLEEAETAYRSALTVDSSSADARVALSSLLAEQDRFDALADVDPRLVASVAEECGEPERAERAWSVLFDRSTGAERASVGARLATLRRALQGPQAELSVLKEAHRADPSHPGLVERLVEGCWEGGLWARLADVVDVLPVITHFRARYAEDPESALDGLRSVRPHFDPTGRARIDEVRASVSDPRLDEAAERRARSDALVSARFIWDQAGDLEGGARVRLALVDLLRATPEAPTRLDALEDAWNEIRAPAERGRVGLELAALRSGEPEAALAILEALLELDAAPSVQRAAAEAIVAEVHGSELSDSERTAHEILLETGRLSEDGCRRLSMARESAFEAPERVAEPLEQLLPRLDGEARVEMLARLRQLWDDAGEAERALVYARAAADTSDSARDWVALAELHAWLGQLDLALEATSRALKADQNFEPALEQRIQLAERMDDALLVARSRLEYAEYGDQLGPRERSDLCLGAARAFEASGRVGEAASALERAAAAHPLPERVDEALDRAGDAEARSRILRIALEHAEARARPQFRARLAAVLQELGRDEEALTVLASGLGPSTPWDDPAVDLLLEPRSQVNERKLLEWADRIGDGGAGPRLRAEAARRAEASGDVEVARSAWSEVMGSARPGLSEREEAHEALLRLARSERDPLELVAALERAAESGPSSEALWLEAARVAEEELRDLDRAGDLLERGRRQVRSATLESAFIGLQERHERWLLLDAWLESRQQAARGEDRARWALMRAERMESRLGELESAAKLYAEAYDLAGDPSVGLALAGVEHRLGRHDLAEVRTRELLSDPDLSPELRVRAARARAEALEAAGRWDEGALTLAAESRRDSSFELLFDELRQLLVRRASPGALIEALLSSVDRVPTAVGMQRLMFAAEVAALEREDVQQALELLDRAASLESITHGQRLELAERALRLEAPDRAWSWALGVPGGERIRLRAAEAVLLSGGPTPESLRSEAIGVPDSAEGDWVIGKLEGDPDRLESAARALEGVDGPRAVRAWTDLARAAAERGEVARALESLDRAELSGTVDESALADVLAACPATVEAAEAHVRAALGRRRDPRAIGWVSRSVEIYERIDDSAAADGARRLGLALDPEETSDRALHELQVLEETEELFGRLTRRLAESRDGAEVEARLRLWAGNVAARMGRFDEVVGLVEPVIGLGRDLPEALRLLEETHAARGDLEARTRALESLAGHAPLPEVALETFLRLARLRAEAGAHEGALDALDAARGSASGLEHRSFAEVFERHALAANAPERAARAWAGLAAADEGAIAALARSAELRWQLSSDRRGAVAAIEAARRRAPHDLDVARMAVEMHERLGDPDAAAGHARRAADEAGGSARVAFMLERARNEEGLEPWLALLDAAEAPGLFAKVLEHLSACHRSRELVGLEAALEERGLTLPQPLVTAPEALLEVDESRRAELDLGGRWTELAAVEAVRAEALDDPRARSQAWLDIADIYARLDRAVGRADQRLALERAVEADPMSVPALCRALEAALEDGDDGRARELVQALDELGGAGWPPPRFELRAADAHRDDASTRARWLERASARDPGNREALELLALGRLELGDTRGAEEAMERCLARVDARLEPELAGRCRRLRARIIERRSGAEAALEVLDPGPEDAAERLRLLEAASASPERIREALFQLWTVDGDLDHLVRSARMGGDIERLEAVALRLEPSAPKLEAALLAARARELDGAALLDWGRRRGLATLSAVGRPGRIAAAREAARQGDASAAADLLRDLDDAAVAEAVDGLPLARLVDRVETGRIVQRELLVRLGRVTTASEALRARLDHLLSDRGNPEEQLEALRRRFRAAPTVGLLAKLRKLQPGNAGAAVAAAWLREGGSPEMTPRLPSAPSHSTAVPAELRFPWSVGRIVPFDGDHAVTELATRLGRQVRLDPMGGSRASLLEDATIVLGAGLLDVASLAELRFHLWFLAFAPSVEPLEAMKVGLFAAGSLSTAIDGHDRYHPSARRDRADRIEAEPRIRELFVACALDEA